jgi:rubredoxin
MQKETIRAWSAEVGEDEPLRVYFVLPDTFFDVALFMCKSCPAIFAVDRDAEHHSGQPFEELRRELVCPECGAPLLDAVEYPGTFRYPDGTEGHFTPPRTYPPDCELVTLEVWNPYT